ncbi:ROK family protein [Streptomyces sp. NPDC019396]|uniref:ROK family protein n=1 Tax=Streptomyces sp. NPDC019396 TaxID=3154687 RepID=UPI00340540F9
MRRAAAVGIDVGGTKLLMLADDGDGQGPGGSAGVEVVQRVETGPLTTPAEVEAAIAAFLTQFGIEPTALGIAVPGLVENGRVVVSDVLPQLAGWGGPEGYRVSPLLVNDIRGALAQETASLPRSATAAVVVCGTAVGSAYLAEGRVIRGARGWAGEIGSLPMATPGGVSRLDELAGGAAIVRAAGMSPESVHAALADGDRQVRTVVRAAGEAFGLALASLINVLNPDTVRVAGGTLGYHGYWDAALTTAQVHALPELWSACTVARIEGRERDRLVARGAARLAMAMGDGRQEWARQYL